MDFKKVPVSDLATEFRHMDKLAQLAAQVQKLQDENAKLRSQVQTLQMELDQARPGVAYGYK